MTECKYHPGIEAVAKCERCQRDICEADIRNYEVIVSSGGKYRSEKSEVKKYCVLCYCKSTKSGGNAFFILLSILMGFMGINLIQYFITGKLWIFDLIAFIIVGIIISLLFLLLLFIKIRGGNRYYDFEKTELFKGLTWKLGGDADTTVNELLELSPIQLEEHVNSIYFELTTSEEDAGIRPRLIQNTWSHQDIMRIHQYLCEDIAHWTWRLDLSQRNKIRTAAAFIYLMAIRKFGQETADNLFDTAPFIEPGLMKKILLKPEQAASMKIKKQSAAKLPDKIC